MNIENSNEDMRDKLTVSPKERSCIWYGELTEHDFSTEFPNPHNIEKIANGIDRYLEYKRRKIGV